MLCFDNSLTLQELCSVKDLTSSFLSKDPAHLLASSNCVSLNVPWIPLAGGSSVLTKQRLLFLIVKVML